MTATDHRQDHQPFTGQAMVVVDDISARLHVRPVETSHRYDRAVIAAAMAEVLTRQLAPHIAVQADGTVWCHIEALAEHGFAPDEATGVIARRAAATWEETIVAHVDLAAVELAGQRTHVQASATGTLWPGQMVSVRVNDLALEGVDLREVDPVVDAAWERSYGIGAAAAIRTAATIAAAGAVERADQVRAVRAAVTWPIERSPWTMTAALALA